MRKQLGKKTTLALVCCGLSDYYEKICGDVMCVSVGFSDQPS